MNIFTLLPLILRAAQYGPQIVAAFETGKALLDIFRELSPDMPRSASKQAEAMFDPEYVRWVQEALNTAGYGPLDVDGEYGSATKGAVMKFQAAQEDLVVDGWCGLRTRAALQAVIA